MHTGLNRALSALALPFAMAFSAAPVLGESPSGESAGEHEGGHALHKNVLGVFAGVTHAGRRKNEPALGLEYARRINESFSIAGVAEYTFGEADLWVFAVPVAYHAGPWKFYAGPGIEDGHHGTEGLVRVGFEYAFELAGGWEIAPQVNVDLVDGEEAVVMGVFFARGF